MAGTIPAAGFETAGGAVAGFNAGSAAPPPLGLVVVVVDVLPPSLRVSVRVVVVFPSGPVTVWVVTDIEELLEVIAFESEHCKVYIYIYIWIYGIER